MYIYLCVLHIYGCACIHICLYNACVYVCIYVYIYICVCVCVCMCVWEFFKYFAYLVMENLLEAKALFYVVLLSVPSVTYSKSQSQKY